MLVTILIFLKPRFGSDTRLKNIRYSKEGDLCISFLFGVVTL